MTLTPFPAPTAGSGSESGNIIDCLEHWAAVQPDKCLYSFLDIDGRERDAYTYLAFHERTRHLAQHLSVQKGLKRGDRVMLVYPPGLELLATFFACARAGIIPVPVYPPTPMNFESGLAKLTFVAQDCQARPPSRHVVSTVPTSCSSPSDAFRRCG